MKRIVALGLLLLSPMLMADEDPISRLKAIQSSSELSKKAYESGKEAIVFCGYCHGVDGNSKRNRIPNLAAQNPVYLFSAFEQFGNGQRTDYVMTELAQSLTLEEKVNIAVYYSQQQVAVKEAETPEKATAGQVVYEKHCQKCHGSEGLGAENIPRLAGQPMEYVRRTLTAFRDKDPRRHSEVMRFVAERLSDEEIEGIANYLQTLNP